MGRPLRKRQSVRVSLLWRVENAERTARLEPCETSESELDEKRHQEGSLCLPGDRF